MVFFFSVSVRWGPHQLLCDLQRESSQHRDSNVRRMSSPELSTNPLDEIKKEQAAPRRTNPHASPIRLERHASYYLQCLAGRWYVTDHWTKWGNGRLKQRMDRMQIDRWTRQQRFHQPVVPNSFERERQGRTCWGGRGGLANSRWYVIRWTADQWAHRLILNLLAGNYFLSHRQRQRLCPATS